MFREIMVTLLLLSLSPVMAVARDISVEAAISPTRISSQDTAQLTLTVQGKINVDPPLLPAIDGFDARYLGTSTSISIVNGKPSRIKSFIYNLLPNKTGRLQVPSLTMTIGGESFVTKPVDIEVVEASAGNEGSDPAGAQGLLNHIFLSLSTPHAQVYVGQKVPFSIKLYVKDVALRNIQFPKLEKNGYRVDNFPQPGQYSREVDGVKFDVVDFSTNLYPMNAGDLVLGPVQIEGSQLYKTQEPQNLFGNDFFNSFFENVQERPVTVTSQSLTLKVLDLPQQGKPSNFSGAIGKLDFAASSSPDQVKVGDPVTLRMKISGDGNLKNFEIPVFNDSRFKTYDPQIKDEDDAKVMEQVIIPNDSNLAEVPAISFSYFDPLEGTYKTKTQGAFPLKVTAPAPGQEFKAVGFNTFPAPGTLSAPVDYVEKYIKAPVSQLITLLKTGRFWLGILALLLMGAGAILFYRFRDRLRKDAAFARRLLANKRAREGIKQAQEQLNAGRAREFYDGVFKTLNTYLADKLQKPAGNMTWESLMPQLKKRQVPVEVITAVKEILDACDQVRFAAVCADHSSMDKDLKKLQEIISVLEPRFLRRGGWHRRHRVRL